MSDNMAFVSIHYDRNPSPAIKPNVAGFSKNITGVWFLKYVICTWHINTDSKGEYESLIANLRLELNNYFGQETRLIRP